MPEDNDFRSYVRLDLVLYLIVGVICALALATFVGYECDVSLVAALIGLATAMATALVTAYARRKKGG